MSKEVKRYYTDGQVFEGKGAEWVSAEDYDALFAEREALREAIAQAVEYLDVSCLEQIASGSIIHQRMRAALQGEQP